MDGHAFLDEVRRIFDGEDVAVTPRTLLTDARWIPPPAPPPLASLDGARSFLRWLYAGTEGLIETRELPGAVCRFWPRTDLRELGRYLDIERTRTGSLLRRGHAPERPQRRARQLPTPALPLRGSSTSRRWRRTRPGADWPRGPRRRVRPDRIGRRLYHAYWKLATPIDLRTDAPARSACFAGWPSRWAVTWPPRSRPAFSGSHEPATTNTRPCAPSFWSRCMSEPWDLDQWERHLGSDPATLAAPSAPSRRGA